MESMSELKPLLREIKMQRDTMSDRNSAAFGSTAGGRSSSGGRGGTGGEKNASSSAKKGKKAGWEDAGVEFYQEAYPGPVDNLFGTHIRTLLPSKRYSVGTIGRTVRRRSNRSFRRHPSSAATTLVHTTRRGSDTYLEVMPDLTQGVDEEETWEQLQQIRLQAVPMREKKELKRQLMSVPTLRTKGFAAVHLSRRKLANQIKSQLREFAGKFGVWKGNLRFVEGNFGTGLVAFFTFIKWLLYLNLFSSLLIILFIVVPQAKYSEPEDWCNEIGNFTRSLSIFSSSFNATVPLSLPSIAPSTEYIPMPPTSAPPIVRTSSLPHSTLPPTGNHISTPSFIASTSVPRPVTLLNVTSPFIFQLNTTYGPFDLDYPINDSAEFLPLVSQSAADEDCCFLEYKKQIENRDSNAPFLLQILLDCLQGTGKLELSQLFYGFYPRVQFSVKEFNGWSYSLPLAYISVMVFILFISLICMVRKAARGLKEKLRSSEGQFYQTSNMVFGGWDHCIENTKAANIKKKAIYNELKNFLATERYKEEKVQRTRRQRVQLFFVRIFINMVVILILAGSFYSIYLVTRLSLEKLNLPVERLLSIKQNPDEISQDNESDIHVDQAIWWKSLVWEYMPVGTIVVLNIIVPPLFRILVKFERYTPNFILSFTLFRTVFLRLASLVVLMFTVYQKIRGCSDEPTDNCTNPECVEQLQCWETFVGQQMYKLVLLDLVTMIVSTFLINFPRKIVGDHLLRGSRIGELIGGIEFGLPKHVLDIVYGQTLCWLGMFYSPLLPIIASFKLVLVFYIKYFDCCVNTSQSSQLYRTSRSNSLFITILLFSFVVTIIPVGFSIVELRPSSSCGPFYNLNSIWSEITIMIEGSAEWIQSILFFLGTAGFAMPTIIILVLLWYYYYAVAMANKHMVSLLKHQLILEGHDGQFLLSRLEKMLKRSRELEEMARSEASSEFLGTDCGNDDITLDLRDQN